MKVMEVDQIEAGLEAFVREAGRIGEQDDEFARDVHLFDLGYLDSLGALRLVDHVEATYEIELSSQDLQDPQFSSVQGIARIVATALATGN